jgi:hypothetical protein
MDTTHRARPPALICAVGAALAAVYAVVVALAGSHLSAADNLIGALIYLTLLAGVVALALSGASGPGTLFRIGVGAAALGLGLFVTAELAAEALFAVAPLLTGLGMVLAGIAVAREGRWVGWQRWIALVVGLWLFVVILPVMAIVGEPPAVAAVWTLVGWFVCWALLGLAAASGTPARVSA